MASLESIEDVVYRNALIRRFDFGSGLQRMSVICKNQIDNKYRIFTKGSPEKIAELCDPLSLPHNYVQEYSNYTSDGYRVIALATKVLPELTYRKANTLKRQDVENNLIFLGLLVMQNKLKDESASVIETLNECNIRTVMATGDNIYTSISAARQC